LKNGAEVFEQKKQRKKNEKWVGKQQQQQNERQEKKKRLETNSAVFVTSSSGFIFLSFAFALFCCNLLPSFNLFRFAPLPRSRFDGRFAACITQHLQPSFSTTKHFPLMLSLSLSFPCRRFGARTPRCKCIRARECYLAFLNNTQCLYSI